MFLVIPFFNVGTNLISLNHRVALENAHCLDKESKLRRINQLSFDADEETSMKGIEHQEKTNNDSLDVPPAAHPTASIPASSSPSSSVSGFSEIFGKKKCNVEKVLEEKLIPMVTKFVKATSIEDE